MIISSANPAAKIAFEAMLTAAAAEGRRAGERLRIEGFQIQRRYRKRLAFRVAAGLERLDTYMAGYRSAQDDRNVRVVERYLRLFTQAKVRGEVLSEQKAA
jgi:hypothetical protein